MGPRAPPIHQPPRDLDGLFQLKNRGVVERAHFFRSGFSLSGEATIL